MAPPRAPGPLRARAARPPQGGRVNQQDRRPWGSAGLLALLPPLPRDLRHVTTGVPVRKDRVGLIAPQGRGRPYPTGVTSSDARRLKWIDGTTARFDGYLEVHRRPQPMLDWFPQYIPGAPISRMRRGNRRRRRRNGRDAG